MIELRWIKNEHNEKILQYRFRQPNVFDNITKYPLTWEWSEWIDVKDDS